MSKKEVPLYTLNTYLPKGAYPHLEKYLIRHKVHLTITPERSSVLGNYKGASNGRHHHISVNGSLNKFSFLITLIHELGHLLAFDKYGARIPAHGQQWKNEYSRLLAAFISNRIFPRDIEKELIATLENPGASSCTEASLLRVLRKYDEYRPGFFLLEDLPDGSFFRIKNGNVYLKLHRKRVRILCREIDTNRLFLFSPVSDVQLVHKRLVKQ